MKENVQGGARPAARRPAGAVRSADRVAQCVDGRVGQEARGAAGPSSQQHSSARWSPAPAGGRTGPAGPLTVAALRPETAERAERAHPAEEAARTG
ncbi:hypothetical protein ACWDRR_31030 [Kitasatospora sp. NPDC003701]